MEKKNVQRIVGVLVIVALVIIVMPLLFGKNDFPAQQSENSKESMLPMRATDVAANTDAAMGQQGTTDSASPVEITPDSPQTVSDANASPDMTPSNLDNTTPDQLNTKPTASATNSGLIEPLNATNNTAQSATLPVPDALDANKKPEATTISSTVPAGTLLPNSNATTSNQAAPSNNNATPTPATNVATATTATDQTTVPAAKPVHSKKHIHALHAHAAVKAKPIKAKLAKAHASKKLVAKNSKSPAWVIQMGVFNNKSNATRLTAKLRAAGFKVFTHEIKTASGKVHTRVYVGPELKEASATKLSASVHQKMNMQGIVMLYKHVV